MFEVTSLCLYRHMQPCLPLVNGFVDDALRNTVPSVNEPLLQLVNVAFRFLCNVRQCRNIQGEVANYVCI